MQYSISLCWPEDVCSSRESRSFSLNPPEILLCQQMSIWQLWPVALPARPSLAVLLGQGKCCREQSRISRYPSKRKEEPFQTFKNSKACCCVADWLFISSVNSFFNQPNIAQVSHKSWVLMLFLAIHPALFGTDIPHFFTKFQNRCLIKLFSDFPVCDISHL